MSVDEPVDDFDDDFTPTPSVQERRIADGRAYAERRWGPYRQARLDAGMLPTIEAERGRSTRFFSDRDEEDFWLSELDRLGIAVGASRTTRRMQAKLLAEAQAREITRAASLPTAPPVGDDEVLLSYWVAEATRWHRRSERDLALAEAHRAQAQEAEREVAYLIMAGKSEAGA